MSSVNGQQENTRVLPQSMRHKRILDQAADRPDASLEAIAADIPSVTPELVENVLEKYGDPAENTDNHPAEKNSTSSNAAASQTPANDSVEQSSDDGWDTDDAQKTPDVTDSGSDEEQDGTSETERLEVSRLTDGQRETLAAIVEQPTATQRELGTELDVSAATICNRVNSIPGIDWENRTAILDDGIVETEELKQQPLSKSPEMEDTNNQMEHLAARMTELESRVADHQTSTPSPSGLEDPELARKVMHACLHSEQITEDEELRLLEILLQ